MPLIRRALQPRFKIGITFRLTIAEQQAFHALQTVGITRNFDHLKHELIGLDPPVLAGACEIEAAYLLIVKAHGFDFAFDLARRDKGFERLLVESGALLPRGEHARLFLTEPQTGFSNGLSEKKPKAEPVNHWQRAAQAINEAIIEARHNPETARSLFALASYGRHDPESLERLRLTFANEGIPLELLSHYEPRQPFACLRQNDGLSDNS